MFTALHRELGRQPSILDFGMLEDAVAQGLTEQIDLEWKQKLPDMKGDGWRAELAKDFTAMANASGGVIVYGIVEDRHTSAARELIDIGPTGQRIERELAKVAYSLVSPALFGFETYPLESDDGARHALAVRITPSQQAPHFVRNDKNPQFLGAPVRRARDTFWLTETEIDLAYRARFRAATDRLQSLDDAFVLESKSLEAWSGDYVWLTGVAHPNEPRSAMLAPPSRQDASAALQIGQDTYSRIIEGRPNPHSYDLDVRPGRRRWSATRRTDEHRFEHVGLDGSVVVSQRVGGPDMADGTPIMGVSCYDVELAAAHLVTTIAGVARTLAINGPHLVKVGIHRRSTSLPIRFGSQHQSSHKIIFTGLPVLLSQVHPEVVEVKGNSDDEQLRAAMAEITTLMTSQGGIQDLQLTRPRTTK